ncbi:MAG: hypothetical protein UHN88_09020, partial [Eubacterium sp.]|nr:hypothetical protein [Eubacterium sp.]
MAEVSALLPRVGDPDERKLRKYRDRLIVSGKGVMAFGAWNVIKWVIYMLFRLDAPMIEAEGLAEIEGFVSVFLLVLLLL